MPLDTTRMVFKGHLTSPDIKQYADLLTGVMTDQAVTITNSAAIGAGTSTVTIGAATGQYIQGGNFNFLTFGTNGVPRWNINVNGSFGVFSDNTYDIGESGTRRPRTVYAATSFIGPGAVPVGGGSGQVLGKNTATDYDLMWITPSPGLTLPLGQNLTFAPDNTYDIGVVGANRPRTIYAGTRILVGNGTASAPAYAFNSVTNTGLYWNSGNSYVALQSLNNYIALWQGAAGSQAIEINASGFNSNTGQTGVMISAGAGGFPATATNNSALVTLSYRTTGSTAYSVTSGYHLRLFAPAVGSNCTLGSWYGIAINGAPLLSGGAALGNAYGLNIQNLGAAGVTNAYGIYIAAQSFASTINIGLYNAGTSLLAGAVTAQAGVNVTGGAHTGNGSVPVGGTANQVLAKVDAADYNLAWVAQSGGSGSSSVAVYEATAITGATVTLPVVPASVNAVTVNGQTLMATRDYTLAGAVITFTTALTADDVHVEYMVTPFNYQAYSAHYETTLTSGQSTITLPTTSTGTPMLSRGGVVQYQSAGHYSIAGSVITLGTPIQTTEDGRISVDYIAGGAAYLPISGGTLSGPGNLTVGGTLTVTGTTTLNNHLLFGANNAYDIGTATNAPRDFYVAHQIITPSFWSPAGTDLVFGAATFIRWRITTNGDLGSDWDTHYNIGTETNYRPDTLFIANGIKLGTAAAASKPIIRNPVNDAAKTSLSVEAPGNNLYLSAKVMANLGQNEYNDGTNWMRYDVAQPSALYQANSGTHLWFSAVAGANPLSWTTRMVLDASGTLSLSTGGLIASTVTLQGSGYVIQVPDTTNSIYWDKSALFQASSSGNPAVFRFYAPTMGAYFDFRCIAGATVQLSGTHQSLLASTFESSGYQYKFGSGGSNGTIIGDGNTIFYRSTVSGSHYFQHVDGSFATLFGGAFTPSSARKLKTDIRLLTDPLSLVQDERLHAVRYTVRASGKPSVGFIADDWLPVLPEVVALDDIGDVMALDYDRIGAITFEALKQYVARTDARLAALEGRLAA